MDVRCAGTTVNISVSLSAPTAAMMLVEPAFTVVEIPELLIVATDEEDEVQVTPLVKSELEPSLYVAVTINC